MYVYMYICIKYICMYVGVILFIAVTGVPPVEQATTADDRYLMIAGNITVM